MGVTLFFWKDLNKNRLENVFTTGRPHIGKNIFYTQTTKSTIYLTSKIPIILFLFCSSFFIFYLYPLRVYFCSSSYYLKLLVICDAIMLQFGMLLLFFNILPSNSSTVMLALYSGYN